MSELKAVKRVRMIFNVFNTSNISTSDGKILDTRFLNNKIRVKKINPYIWPTKYRVIYTDYYIWRKFLL